MALKNLLKPPSVLPAAATFSAIVLLGASPTAVAQDRRAAAAAVETSPAFGPENFAAAVDPRADGWDSEALSEQAEAQLKRIAGWLVGGVAAVSLDALDEAVDETFETRGFVPDELSERYTGATFAVSVGQPGRFAYRGVEGFVDALLVLGGRLTGSGSPRADFKLFTIEGDAASFSTRSYFEASAPGAGGSRQLNAVWTTTWTVPPDGAGQPLLRTVEVSDYEETSAAGGPLFVDVTEAAVGHNPSYREQLLQPPDAWLNRITKAAGYNKTGWQGVSVADVNGDGLEDIFLPEQGGLPNRLYLQNPNGTFDDRSAAAAVDYLERALAGLFVDLDNDGDPDLALSSRPAVLVLENDGDGGFARVRYIAGDIPDSNSLSAADYDGDGDLDLYVCAYRRAYDERGVASPVPYHDANNGGRNVLLRNDGGFRFVDATASAGLDRNNRRFKPGGVVGGLRRRRRRRPLRGERLRPQQPVPQRRRHVRRRGGGCRSRGHLVRDVGELGRLQPRRPHGRLRRQHVLGRGQPDHLPAEVRARPAARRSAGGGPADGARQFAVRGHRRRLRRPERPGRRSDGPVVLVVGVRGHQQRWLGGPGGSQRQPDPDPPGRPVKLLLAAGRAACAQNSR